nr:protocadherin beta-16-like [Oncorhynchus nerka]
MEFDSFLQPICIRWRMRCGLRWQVLVSLLYLSHTVSSQIRYSIPEEMKKGSLIGNVAQDLGLDLKRLSAGRARIVTGENIQYTELKTDKGILVVSERIDREQLCGDVTPCSFSFEMILENPMELHLVTVEILDVNDNAPVFQQNDIQLKISESASAGARFVLATADDPDVGLNALQNYILTPNDNFVLKQHTNPDASKYAEMVLQKPLDREEHPLLSLKLIAVDGGNPQRSGTVNIEITVLDANDNAPVFNQSVYRAAVVENALKSTYITTVNASDADSGSNGYISYMFSNLKGTVSETFTIDAKTGVISVLGEIDYEKYKKYEIRIDATDQGGLTDSSKVIVEVIDVNDNEPVISVMSFTSPISEDSPHGTTIGIINVKDLDSGENGQVSCSIDQHIPFNIKSNLRNYYTLLTGAVLDREKVSEYNITVVATDAGSPPLSSKKTFHLKVSDVNDNAPVFPRGVYNSYIAENNSPGVSIFTVRAKDSDSNQNARISYILEDTDVSGTPVSGYVSVNAESGVINAVRSFDYEQIKQLRLVVKAQDGGSPPYSSNVSVNIFIQDQNDNAPQVLYPVQTSSSLVAEMVPRSADVGYLVTKVVAVDVDSGQNAWLSYKLQKATDRALFEVGLQNGEIRTIRQVNDKDAVKQRLTVVVEDNGQPSRSATVNVNVAVADSFPEVLSEFTDFTHDKEYNDNLTLYLVLALAVVSFLFITCLVVIISVKIYRWRQSRVLYHSNLPVIPYYPPRYADTLGTGTLQHVYNYEVCRTTDSRKSDCQFGRPCSQNVLIMDPSSTGTMQRMQSENIILDEPDSPLEVVYNSFVAENNSPGVSIFTVTAKDTDSNQNARISYILEDDTMGTGTLQHVYNYEVCRTTDSRKSDCQFARPCSQNVLIMDPSSTGTMQRMQSENNIMDESDSPLEVSDVNDNAPVFPRGVYNSYIAENNSPGVSIFTVRAKDTDSNQNARISYILEDTDVSGTPVSVYVSVNAESGVINAVRSFDYEQIKQFKLVVKAQDGGSPPLSSNVSGTIFIQDQNDNAPQVLYPVQTSSSLVAEMVPRSADVGYLVTKVVAVDVDSGQNAWLSYKLQKATDRALFEVGLQNGEIRTVRQVNDKDAVKQRLTVVVEDNGQPSRSATVNVNVAVADSFPEVLSEFTDFTHDKEYNDNLTFYLVLALAVVSFLFITCLVVIISVKIYRWRQSRVLYHSNLPVIPYYPPRYADTLGTGTLQHVYNYEVCRTTDSRKSDCQFARPCSQNVLIMDPSSTGTMQRMQNEQNILDEPDSPLEH